MQASDATRSSRSSDAWPLCEKQLLAPMPKYHLRACHHWLHGGAGACARARTSRPRMVAGRVEIGWSRGCSVSAVRLDGRPSAQLFNYFSPPSTPSRGLNGYSTRYSSALLCSTLGMDRALELLVNRTFFLSSKSPEHTHTPQTPTRTELAHSTRTKRTDPVFCFVLCVLFITYNSHHKS